MKKNIGLSFLFLLLIIPTAFAIPDGEGNEIIPLAVGGTFDVTGGNTNKFFLPAPASSITEGLENSQWSLYLNEGSDQIKIAAKKANGGLLELSFNDDFSGVAYTAGNGLTLSNNEFSSNAATCGATQYAYWSGTSWLCRDDDDTTYTAGNGITLSSNEFSSNAATCGATQYAYWSGTSWLCRDDEDTTYIAGNGIDITGTTISVVAATCGAGEFTQWNGSAFICTTPPIGAASAITTTPQNCSTAGDYGNIWYSAGFIWACVDGGSGPAAVVLNTLF